MQVNFENAKRGAATVGTETEAPAEATGESIESSCENFENAKRGAATVGTETTEKPHGGPQRSHMEGHREATWRATEKIVVA
jgi:hypothetical protein